MAILEHFSARVLIDGQACQEYAINKDDGEDETNVKTYPRVINYVEVIPGAHFTVQVTPEKLIEYGTANAISYRLSLDDVLLSSRLVRNEIFTASLPSTGKVMCGQDIEDEFTFRRFIFADVVTRRVLLLRHKTNADNAVRGQTARGRARRDRRKLCGARSNYFHCPQSYSQYGFRSQAHSTIRRQNRAKRRNSGGCNQTKGNFCTRHVSIT